MNEPEVYFDKKTMLYYYCKDPICNNCKEEIEQHTATYIIFHPLRSESYGSLWCSECVQFAQKSCPKVLIGAEIFSIVVGEEIKPDMFVVPIMRIGLHNASDITVFEAALSNKGIKSDTSSTQVVNNCKIGLQTWSDADPTKLDSKPTDCLIGKSESRVDFECGDKNKALSSGEVADFFVGVKESVPLIGSDKKKEVDFDGS